MSTAVLSRPPVTSYYRDLSNTSIVSRGAMEAPISSPQTNPERKPRGRQRTRAEAYGESDDLNMSEAGASGTSKKRRSSRKGINQKFECPHEGCGKRYSRAEHLYRHQLNHNPKQIYHCDFPDCHRSFVRQDLCARHKERHTARGSQLLRRDNFMHHPNPIVLEAQKAKVAAAQGLGNYINGEFSGSWPIPSGHRSHNTDHDFSGLDLSKPEFNRSATFPNTTTASVYGSPRNMDEFARSQQMSLNPQLYRSNSTFTFVDPNQSQSQSIPPSSPLTYQTHQQFPALTSLPPSNYASIGQDRSTNPQLCNSNTSDVNTSNDGRMAGSSADGLPGGIPSTYTMPIFGGEGIERSPLAMADEFAAWLLNDDNYTGPTPPTLQYSTGHAIPQSLNGAVQFGYQSPYMSHIPTTASYLTQSIPPQHPMAANNLLDNGNVSQMCLSGTRRQQIVDLIMERFNDKHAPTKNKEYLLNDMMPDDDNCLLSLNMMNHYLSSFWNHFHPQMPILHKPTFEADKCHELQLIAIIALGATCLEPRFGFEITQKCSELANFLAWHLRWEMFMAKDSRPPAKLWIFQTFLLLEIFEKMYSIRPLHERAHIHHATTLTLMRRGSSLTGRPPMDSPSSTDSRSFHDNVNGQVSSPTIYTSDEWWNQWIINEATRRVAFAAFVMDSLHATMFGHSAVMVAHEMRLPLPCDEALWSATGSAEVGRMEQSLSQRGVRPIQFLDGLKKMLNNQPVRTNSFGRTILMAGLLSVSWHMNQRDLQVSSLGVPQALGGRIKWQGALTRAFDFWKADVNESLPNDSESYNSYTNPSNLEDESMLQSSLVLHHLAHMTQHVDVIDCQIFAGATRLLGRSITPQDYNGAQRRMKEGWALTSRARDATFYALRFLSQIFVPNEHESSHQRPALQPAGHDSLGFYSARDDYLLNRPWVMYIATLIVWSYGFALDGPITSTCSFTDYSQIVKDMEGFLNRVGKVQSPNELRHVINRNACLGLLVIMRDTFIRSRWELLHEASRLLTSCVDLLVGGQAISLPEPPSH